MKKRGIHTTDITFYGTAFARSGAVSEMRPEHCQPKPFVFMVTYSYILYKEI